VNGDTHAENFRTSPNVEIVVVQSALDAAVFVNRLVARTRNRRRRADRRADVIGRGFADAVFDVDERLIFIERKRARLGAVIPLQLVPRPALTAIFKIFFR
jgi:hypothetical protein